MHDMWRDWKPVFCHQDLVSHTDRFDVLHIQCLKELVCHEIHFLHSSYFICSGMIPMVWKHEFQPRTKTEDNGETPLGCRDRGSVPAGGRNWCSKLQRAGSVVRSSICNPGDPYRRCRGHPSARQNAWVWNTVRDEHSEWLGVLNWGFGSIGTKVQTNRTRRRNQIFLGLGQSIGRDRGSGLSRKGLGSGVWDLQ